MPADSWTEDGGAGHGVLALHEMEVGVADAGGAGADEDLVGVGLVDIDIFDNEGLVDAVHDCGLHGGLLGWCSESSRKSMAGRERPHGTGRILRGDGVGVNVEGVSLKH